MDAIPICNRFRTQIGLTISIEKPIFYLYKFYYINIFIILLYIIFNKKKKKTVKIMFKRGKMIKLELELLMFYRVNSLIYISICVHSMFLDSMKMRGVKNNKWETKENKNSKNKKNA